MFDFSFFRTSKKNKSRKSKTPRYGRRLHKALAPEQLEQRVMFNASDLLDSNLSAPDQQGSLSAFRIDPVFAPGTSPQVVAGYDNGAVNATGGFDAFTFNDSDRWSSTPSSGGGLTQGAATTITWSVVPDGTFVSGFNSEPAAPSNLRSFLGGIYGTNSSSNLASDQPWFSVVQQVFDRWSAVAGITYVYEPADDGAALGSLANGVPGIRGDVRLSGHYIDGPSNILAYNFYPNVSDMVIDTGDTFFNNTSGNSLRLRNTMAHESGHGLGLGHVTPNDGTKLMEAFLSLGFDGPQQDDILAVNRGYGDRLEKNGGNDTVAKATSLGSLSGAFTVDTVSIDDDSDTDYFSFTVGASSQLNLTLNPTGSTYNSNGSTFNAAAQSDLALAVYGNGGATLIASANLTPAGQSETLSNVVLSSAGTYYVKITGSANAAQMYRLNGNVVVSAPPAPEITIKQGTTNLTDGQTFDFGSTVQGTPITQTFTVVNDGTATLSLSSLTLATLPSGFSLASDLGSLSLAAGQSTTFSLRLDANLLGTFSGPIQLANNDSDENPFDLTLTGTVTAPTTLVLAVDAGGGAAGTYVADQFFSGGNTFTSGPAVSTSGVTNPAPSSVYQSERYGNFTYTLPGLTPAAQYTVRLHFAEIYFGSAGQRLFNVQINGTPVLNNFDIFADAGGAFKADIKSFTATADAAGKLTISFVSVRDNAKLSGIEILSAGQVSSNASPTVATVASATPNPVIGTTTSLSVLGNDADTGESSLTYTWSVVSAPAGAATPTFSINGTNAAKNSTAAFFKAGSYTLRATVTDPSAASVTSDVVVIVNQTASSVSVTPTSATVVNGGTQSFTATVLDQFGTALSSQPSLTWTIDSGGIGLVNASGLYTAPASGTSLATVRATSGNISGTASVTVVAPSSLVLAVDAGGGAAGSYAADQLFAGGGTYSSGTAISTSGVTNPAPISVYQSERYGNFTYTLPGLTAGTQYTVRLHFAEIYFGSAGQRLFNVQINGAPALTNYDVFADAGGANKAVVKQFTATADSAGKLMISFVSVRDNAKLSGLEILSTGPVTPNAPPTVATVASATPNPVTGTTANLSVLGNDADTGESSLTYTWSVVSAPAGAATPTFSVNGTNAAKNSTATFFQAGSYTLRATLTDPAAASVTSDVNVTVNQTASSVSVTPTSATVVNGGTQSFSATVLDQFGTAVSSQPSLTWTIDGGGIGSVNASGLYTAPVSGTGSATVRATSGSISGTASVTVVAPSSLVLALDAGGGAAGSYAADQYFSGGNTYSTGAAINTSGVSNPAPQTVYQTERYGNFTYALPGLTPGAQYTVRLHFAELYWTAAGQRLFNVQINGVSALTNYDVFADAGGANKAVVKQFTATADAAGKITISFLTVRDNAKLSGIEILAG